MYDKVQLGVVTYRTRMRNGSNERAVIARVRPTDLLLCTSFLVDNHNAIIAEGCESGNHDT